MTMPRLRAPIVLVHGLFGFGRLRMGSWMVDYFNGIPRALEEAGNQVRAVQLSPTAGIAARAAQLRTFLDQQLPGESVHLLAHSMGGLDARHMITHLGMAPRVLTLTTLGTPHRGSVVADRARARLSWFVQPFFDFIGLSRQGFDDLTVEACREFNERTPDAPGVRYFSVAGRYKAHWPNPSWGITEPLIRKREGPNDGLVSIASASWGESCEVWDGDHMALVNWASPWAPGGHGRHLGDFQRHLGRLREEGF